MRKRYTITCQETIQGKEYKMYYEGGHWRYSANIKNAKGFYTKEKAEELLNEINNVGYGNGHIIEII